MGSGGGGGREAIWLAMTDLRDDILLQKKVEKEAQRASLSINGPTSLALTECNSSRTTRQR